MIQLAVFLGNPGSGYARHRHNAGRMLAQALPFYQSLSWKKKYRGLYAFYDNRHFLMPETYMNLSGESVFAAAAFYKIKINEILIVHDELELPLGYLSLKDAGGLGGHNGLRSMNKCFGSADFWRLRIGLGRPDARLPGQGGMEGSGEGIVDWVLSNFTSDEKEALVPVFEAGAELLQKTFVCEPETLLNEWKKKKVEIPTPEVLTSEDVLEKGQYDSK
jgi:PTH1 family peptidyl-tRNA hydrolase